MRRAIAFLTPLGPSVAPTSTTFGWFPLVGAAIGLIVGGVWWAADRAWSPMAAAAVTVIADIAITGYLHLDGLADSADGLLPPLARSRRLEVMRDPAVGAFGAVTVMAVLLLRFGALASRPAVPLVVAGLWCGSRTAMVAIARTLAYARPDGGLVTAFVPSAIGGFPRRGSGVGPPVRSPLSWAVWRWPWRWPASATAPEAWRRSPPRRRRWRQWPGWPSVGSAGSPATSGPPGWWGRRSGSWCWRPDDLPAPDPAPPTAGRRCRPDARPGGPRAARPRPPGGPVRPGHERGRAPAVPRQLRRRGGPRRHRSRSRHRWRSDAGVHHPGHRAGGGRMGAGRRRRRHRTLAGGRGSGPGPVVAAGVGGRDPAGLDAKEMARAVVESVAENTVDGVVAPALWGAVAGAPGALGLRAANTLDSMVGHRSSRYSRYGWAGAGPTTSWPSSPPG